MTSWRLVAAWLVGLGVATLISWQIVSFADTRVGARAVEVGSVASSVSSTSSLSPSSSTTLSTSTSAASVTTSSTVQANDAEWSFRTINTSGGNVVIRYRPNEVELEAATPAPGFNVEVDDAGPQRVRVEFEGDTADVRVEARWEDGALDVAVNESG